MPTIHKIVITGGPCAGKTTAMSWIQNAFTSMGFTVLFVPETATELIGGGVAPWTCGTNRDYQLCQVDLQIKKEQLFEQAARTMPVEKILIVCDRGVLDNKAYMTAEDFAFVMHKLHVSEIELRDGYDAVFHLVTAAKGAEEFYTTSNNSARIETPERACELDDQLLASWTGHPRLRVIDNATMFETKMRRLISEITAALGLPGLKDRQRKFLIEYPDVSRLESLPSCRKVEIIQTYLKSAPDEERRVNQRGLAGHYIYYETIRRDVNGESIEIEKRLTMEEYLTLLMEADTTLRQIRKTRYCMTWRNQYFEVDVFPFWQDRAIAEIELADETDKVVFPEELKIIREVTDDREYKNSALAGKKP